MLLLDDNEELPSASDESELLLAARLGTEGLQRIDENLVRHARSHWLKVARVVADAVTAGSFPLSDESVIRLHVRRVVALADSGALQSTGDLRKPRWSEVRLPEARDMVAE